MFSWPFVEISPSLGDDKELLSTVLPSLLFCQRNFVVLKMVPAKENIKRKEGGVKGKTFERKNIWSKDKEEHVLETENCLGRL